MVWDRWQTYALGSALFAGLTAILGKIGVTGVNSNYATFIRTVVILAFIAGLVSVREEWQKITEISGRSLIFLVLSGLATGLSWICYYRALQLGPASKVAPVDKLSVGFAIILALVFLKEPLTWQTVVGGLLVVSGSLVLAFL
ncbi:MAG: EamA family transporter [Chitinophagaceae bacterium]|nr:EamA family transporter [Oligoflexus sp.]